MLVHFLQVAGKPYKKFIENQNKIMKTWILPVDGTMFRVVLEKDTLDIWVNGTKVIQKRGKQYRLHLFLALRWRWQESSQTKGRRHILQSVPNRPT